MGVCQISLSSEEIKTLGRAINLHHLDDEECNKMDVNGKYVSKYPEKECKELIDAGFAIHREYSAQVEVEFSEATGMPISWKIVSKEDKMNKTEKIMEELSEAGYSAAIAVATEAEINAGAACGQLAIIEED